MNTYDEVLFSEQAGEEGDLGLITLNRPAALNSLNHTMIQLIHAQLKKWAVASHIKAVVIRATEGRAFCAGGDIRLAYERMKQHDLAAVDFFREEYALNKCIFHFPKPYIALLDGMTMGGGVGVSIHGSHRVVTDNVSFAMPETGIGFFPDVGGTYFLPRLPNYFGFYLGLVGTRINADDCVELGIAQQKMAPEAMNDLLEGIAAQPFGRDPNADVSRVIEQFRLPVKPSMLLLNQALVQRCFDHNTVENIISALETENCQFADDTLKSLLKKSPTSLKVTLAAMRKGRELNFDACMDQEFLLTSHFVRQHDFPEGIEAVIIRKDHTPRWKPATLAEVSAEIVASYFQPI